MQNSINNDFVSCDFKQDPPYSDPQTILGQRTGQFFDIARQSFLQEKYPIDNPLSIGLGERRQIFFGSLAYFNFVSHLFAFRHADQVLVSLCLMDMSNHPITGIDHPKDNKVSQVFPCIARTSTRMGSDLRMDLLQLMRALYQG